MRVASRHGVRKALPSPLCQEDDVVEEAHHLLRWLQQADQEGAVQAVGPVPKVLQHASTATLYKSYSSVLPAFL